MSKTLKTTGIVYLISCVPLLMLCLMNWNGVETLAQLIHMFLLMTGFMGGSIFLLTLLYEFLIAGTENDSHQNTKGTLVKINWKFTIIVNLFIFVGGVYFTFDVLDSNSDKNIIRGVHLYIEEYLIMNIMVTIISILIPTIYHRNKKIEDGFKAIPKTARLLPAKHKKRVPNDKTILIKNVKLELLKLAIEQFCADYNGASIRVTSELIIISKQEFVIKFPSDISFELFCYFVNYLYYPINISYQPEIKAWATLRKPEQWVAKKMIGKKVMLFILDGDTDAVYLTTQDNIGYKVGFAINEASQLLDKPKMMYQKPEMEGASF